MRRRDDISIKTVVGFFLDLCDFSLLLQAWKNSFDLSDLYIVPVHACFLHVSWRKSLKSRERAGVTMGCHLHRTPCPLHPSLCCVGGGIITEGSAVVKEWKQQLDPSCLIRLQRCSTEKCFVYTVSGLHCGTFFAKCWVCIGDKNGIQQETQCTWYSWQGEWQLCMGWGDQVQTLAFDSSLYLSSLPQC